MRSFFLAFLGAVSSAVLFAACGGTVATTETSGTTSGAGGHAATSSATTSTSSTSSSASTSGTSSGGNGGSATLCPATAPTVGGACDVPGSVSSPPCTYGSDPVPQCRAGYACADGLWAQVMDAFGACPSKTGCPAAPPANDSDCTGAPDACSFAGGTLCSCGTFAGTRWTCFTPSGSCPALPPNAGTACTGTPSCAYEGCNVFMECAQGVWVWEHVAC